ncbi:hypothetical protein WICMUC_001198 [Wickerhamomyces mucosus]|uniref:Major facilitator superfamily (MFS) profile domain-containing protein n=1 Tax=Wickerhamomyces mucosus TaxID=1378264 RepID=A0A9P8PVI7_9ASCO|nr:hypothetical protein WICMUC_001198 [Wickerhamomyces mucosus]
MALDTKDQTIISNTQKGENSDTDNQELLLDEPSTRKQRNKIYEAFRALFIWYPSSYSAEEKKLLVKLDASILFYGCLTYFVKSLDSSNVNNAYVSGMKESLSLYGNELNWLNISFQMGYVVGQVPFLLLLSRPKASRYLFPILELIYGALTIVQSKVTRIDQLYALRFILGIVEAPTYAGIHYIFGKWYSNRAPKSGGVPEIYARAGVWFLSLSLGSIVSGNLQSAAYTHLSGKLGHSGWQWLFIIDGIITLPSSLIGFFFFPGIPEAGKPWFLTDNEYALVFKRLKSFDIEHAKKITFQTFKDSFTDIKYWLMVFNYTIMCICWYPIAYLSLWMKAQGTYTVQQINQIPTGCYGLGVVVSFIGTTLAGVFGPGIMYTIGASGPLIGAIILSVYHVPEGAIFFGFYIQFLINITSPILYSYVSIVYRKNSEKKAFTVGSLMTSAQFVNPWIALALFPTSAKNKKRAAPQWNIGWRVVIVLSILMIITFWLVIYLHERSEKANTDSSFDDESELDNDDDRESSSENFELGVVNNFDKSNTKTVVNEIHSD